MAGDRDDVTTKGWALETFTPDAATVEDPNVTLRPTPADFTDPAGHQAVLSLLEAVRSGEPVQLGDPIGMGGMGVVHLAEQVTLGRTVAVKRLKASKDSSKNILALLREAWVTGSLEHPNVVPVHDVGLDAEGRPFLVMKRIEGEHWGRLIRNDATVRERFQVTDVLAWHVGVMIQVCNAVSFAHDRGVLHRDLKPENVMVGAFGEVYLLDWGVAVALTDDRDGRLPLAENARGVAGTPAYMAPEMLAGGVADERTDVYLLGSVLYEVLTGKPPHSGVNAQAVIESVGSRIPPRPDGPEDLVDLCMRCFARSKDHRPQSAREFQIELRKHLERRGAATLADEAHLQLERLVAALGDPEHDHERIWRWFGEVRFGFRQALRVWPENAAARTGLTRAVSAMAEWEMRQGDWHSAARLVAEPDTDVDTALVKRIRDEVDRIERTLADRDPIRGMFSRWALAVALGTLWTAFPLMAWFSERVPEYGKSIRTDSTWFVIALIVGVIFRKQLDRTTFNRRTYGLFLIAPACNVLLAYGASIMDVPMASYMVFQVFVWMMLAIAGTLMLDWRLFPVPIAYAVGFLIAAKFPGTDTLVSAIGNGTLTAAIAIIWWPGGRRAAATADA